MSRHRTQVLIGGGVVALLAVLAVPAKRSPVVAPPPQIELALRPVMKGVSLAVAAARLEAQRLRTESNAWGRDPFAHVPEPELAPEPEAELEREPEVLVEAPPPTAVPDPQLGGVSRVGTSWLALIDGELVRIGETLRSGHTVVAITDDSVTLRRAEHALTLRLGGNR